MRVVLLTLTLVLISWIAAAQEGWDEGEDDNLIFPDVPGNKMDMAGAVGANYDGSRGAGAGARGPAMQPTKRPVAQPTGGDDDETCPLVSSGFGLSDFNGDWTYVGEHDGKPLYQNVQNAAYFVLYSRNCGQYMITSNMEGTSCQCGCCNTIVLSECKWECYDGMYASALILSNCGGSSPSGPSRSRPGTRTEVAHVMHNENENVIPKLVPPPADQQANDPALITINITVEQALLGAVAMMICVALAMMARRAGSCRKASYAKVLMVSEDSEAEQTEAEQALHISN